jgi:hypothetical protein
VFNPVTVIAENVMNKASMYDVTYLPDEEPGLAATKNPEKL